MGAWVNNTKRIVILGLMVAQALVLSIIESWIPVLVPVPGVKLGLANIITLVVIIFFDLKDALAVVLLRCVLSSIFGGGLTGFLFSIAGGLLSAIVMYFLYKRGSKVFSIIGISIAGAVCHNLGQVVIASFVMKDIVVYTILPVLLISGVIMGLFVGLCSNFLEKALRNTKIFT
ncbi:Gx transporter family protein [Acetivibrio cellulolyticus]|uniref:Gx transporter family protein n=1 Tax=Acetivibrio cellulolyticus TaxID=35830 RepID=UPI0004753916